MWDDGLLHNACLCFIESYCTLVPCTVPCVPMPLHTCNVPFVLAITGPAYDNLHLSHHRCHLMTEANPRGLATSGFLKATTDQHLLASTNTLPSQPPTASRRGARNPTAWDPFRLYLFFLSPLTLLPSLPQLPETGNATTSSSGPFLAINGSSAQQCCHSTARAFLSSRATAIQVNQYTPSFPTLPTRLVGTLVSRRTIPSSLTRSRPTLTANSARLCPALVLSRASLVYLLPRLHLVLACPPLLLPRVPGPRAPARQATTSTRRTRTQAARSCSPSSSRASPGTRTQCMALLVVRVERLSAVSLATMRSRPTSPICLRHVSLHLPLRLTDGQPPSHHMSPRQPRAPRSVPLVSLARRRFRMLCTRS